MNAVDPLLQVLSICGPVAVAMSRNGSETKMNLVVTTEGPSSQVARTEEAQPQANTSKQGNS